MSKNLLGYLSEKDLETMTKDSPYTEIDGLVFAVFSYAPIGPDLRGFDGEFCINPIGKTMGELSEILINTKCLELLSIRFSTSVFGDFSQHLRFFKYITENRRYKDIKITGFSYDNRESCQFSAYTFKLSRKEYVIAYRGTDNSLEGWYETYKMHNCDIPGQILALKYLQKEMQRNKGLFRLTGHSKGGRLAVGAAVNSRTTEKINIRSIINFDGPGFDLGFISRNYKDILAIQHKTYLFAPMDTIVSAMFFGHEILYYEKNIRHIKPYGLQIAPSQHLYFNWTLNNNNKFEICPQSKLSLLFKEKTQELLFSYEPHEIEEIIEDMFLKAQKACEYRGSGHGLSSVEVMKMFMSLTLKLSMGKKTAARKNNKICSKRPEKSFNSPKNCDFVGNNRIK